MIRNIQKTLETWCRKYNERFGLVPNCWSAASYREASVMSDRPHIAIGMVSKTQHPEDWEGEKSQILGFFPRIFEIEFSTRKALIFIDDRGDDFL